MFTIVLIISLISFTDDEVQFDGYYIDTANFLNIWKVEMKLVAWPRKAGTSDTSSRNYSISDLTFTRGIRIIKPYLGHSFLVSGVLSARMKSGQFTTELSVIDGRMVIDGKDTFLVGKHYVPYTSFRATIDSSRSGFLFLKKRVLTEKERR